jgi:signal transduction histidine kinase
MDTGRLYCTKKRVRSIYGQRDLAGLQDAYGVNYTHVEIFLAQDEGGYIFYHYYNPARNMTLEPKMSYVQKVDEEW